MTAWMLLHSEPMVVLRRFSPKEDVRRMTAAGAGRVDPGTSGSGIDALADLAFAAFAAAAHCVTVSVFKFSVP